MPRPRKSPVSRARRRSGQPENASPPPRLLPAHSDTVTRAALAQWLRSRRDEWQRLPLDDRRSLFDYLADALLELEPDLGARLPENGGEPNAERLE